MKKKYLLSMAVLMMGIASLTSCTDDEEETVGNNTTDDEVVDNTGESVNKPLYDVYVVNAGNSSGIINGSLTGIRPNSWETDKDAFLTANRRNLGLTPNDGIVYGSKLYVVVTDENTVEVIDNSTLKSLQQIRTTDMMGSSDGSSPRHITAANGKIYVSTYGGYVAAIDTATYAMTDKYAAGSYPEGLAVHNNSLYVLNSDYAYGNNPSISIIDLATGQTSDFRDPLITNPVAIATNENGVFVLDYGTYDEFWTQTNAGIRKIDGGNVRFVAAATGMSMAGTKIYTYNAPYSYPSTTPTYSIYDTAADVSTTFIQNGDNSTNPDAPFSPLAICADPANGYVYITSYAKDPDTSYPGYNIDGYMNVYDMSGNLVQTVPTGVGPTAIVLGNGIQ